MSVRDRTPSLIKLVEKEAKVDLAQIKFSVVLYSNNLVQYWGTTLADKIGIFFSYNIEPFLYDYLTHSKLPSAYPPNPARTPAVATAPMNIFFEWENPTYDTDYLDAITQTATRLRDLVAKEQGALYENSPRYDNYAVYNTPLANMHGENLPLLQELKKKYDPKGVMNLAGGWKF